MMERNAINPLFIFFEMVCNCNSAMCLTKCFCSAVLHDIPYLTSQLPLYLLPSTSYLAISATFVTKEFCFVLLLNQT